MKNSQSYDLSFYKTLVFGNPSLEPRRRITIRCVPSKESQLLPDKEVNIFHDSEWNVSTVFLIVNT